MTKEIYDFVIVGAGAAALASAVYAARYRLKNLVIGLIPGGIAGTAHEVCNYPGFNKINGMELMIKFLEQVKHNDIEIKQEIVQEIKKEKFFKIKTNKAEYFAKKILLATGSERKKLGIKKENDFVGKGISYCATCDSGFYKNKIVGVVGGSDAALTATLLISKFAKKIYLMYRKSEFTKSEPAWVEEVKKDKKIQVLFETFVTELFGKEKLESVKIETKGKSSELKVDGLFIEIGSTPNTKLAEQLGIKLEKGEIAVDKNQRTNVEGVFAAGDVTTTPFKQIITAAAGGSIAAYTAYKEIGSEKAKK